MIKQKLKNLFGIFQGILVIALVLVVSLLIFTSFNPIKSLQVFRVMSGSMVPTLKVGSVVFVQKINPKELKEGEIITYRSNEDPNISVTHRLVAIEEKNGQKIFKTKGDANNAPDATDILASQITGKVIFHIPFLGFLSVWIKKPLGFISLVILPALLIIFGEILSIKKTIEKEAEKKYRNLGPLLLFILIGVIPFQIKITNASLADQAKIEGTKFSAGCWVPPSIPLLVSPSDETYAGNGSSWILNPRMDWTDSVSTCPLSSLTSYYYESYRDLNLSQLAYRSGKLSNSFIPAPSTPDGVYYWRVKACDSLNNCSAWSTVWKLTVDRVSPSSSLDELPPSTNLSPFSLTYTASDNVLLDHTNLCYSFNLNPWICDDDFNFTFPSGQGIYYFDTIAYDTAGNAEKSVDNDPLYISTRPQILFDNVPPTTNVVTPTNSFSGQNLIDLPTGPQTILSNQSIIHDFYLPKNYTGNLEFSYRFQSNDTGLNDHFDVGFYFQDGENLIQNILTEANNTGSLSYDTGWVSVSHSITNLANRLLRLVFAVTDVDPSLGFESLVEIDNLKISSLDTRVGTTTPIDFISTDNLSDIATTTPPLVPPVGENVVDFSAIDTSANVESTSSSSVVVLAKVVLNKINPTSSTIELFNNSDITQNLDGFILDLGTTTILSGTIPANNSAIFNLIIPDSGRITLKDNFSNVLDSTLYSSLLTASFERSVNGLGPWIKINAPLSVNLESRLSVGKVTLSIFGITPEITDVNFTLNYTVSSLPQQVIGLMTTTNRDLFLGTCSSGDCLTPAGIGSSFIVSLDYKNSGVNTTLPPVVFNL
jgi:signal peptidase